MRDFIRRLLVGGMLVIFVSALFVITKHTNAQEITGQTVDWIWPTDGEITDTYGTRRGMHKGIDIAAEPRTPVYAVDGGIVSKSYYSDTYGHVVFIKHQNNFETVYAHLHKRNVSEGQNLKQGDLIGQMGNTGDSSGVHLHFEVHKEEWTYSKENAIDPDRALGSTEVGQIVYAQSKSDGSIETAAHPQHLNRPAKKIIESHQEQTIRSEDKHGDLHVVQPGDTLWSISQKYNISVQGLVARNNLVENQLAIGQELYIDYNNVAEYQVVPGDTLFNISKKTGKSVAEIMKKNHLTDDTIYPHQILIVE